jgi:hypothetical protein
MTTSGEHSFYGEAGEGERETSKQVNTETRRQGKRETRRQGKKRDKR